jgi:hypothetical protein
MTSARLDTCPSEGGQTRNHPFSCFHMYASDCEYDLGAI